MTRLLIALVPIALLLAASVSVRAADCQRYGCDFYGNGCQYYCR